MDINAKILSMEKDITEVKEQLSELINLVQQMNKGLYGDEKNAHIGAIKRIQNLEDQMIDVQAEIYNIKRKNEEQDIALRTKNTYKQNMMDFLKEIGKWIINIIVIFAVLKGLFGLDALIKL